jgi:protein-S-isoprenylcysteine O-methyltransferase Ste14
LGRWFTTDVRTDTAQPVIDAGPYRWVRHPSYTAAMVALLAVGLTFDNWVSLAAMVVLPLIGFGVRIRVEERALLNALGEPYRELSASPTATTPAPTGGWYPASGDRRR